MAGSRRSPVLRDEWSTAADANDQSHRERQRSRGSQRDRGRDRHRDKERRRRVKEGRPNPALRSPPPRAFAHPGERPPRAFSPSAGSTRGGSPGVPPTASKSSQKTDTQSSEMDRFFERDHRGDGPPSAPPPFKRKRTRSPSPRGYHNHHSNQQPPHRPSFNKGDEFARGPPPKRGRGRFQGRGRSGRRSSPRRGRDRRKNDPGRRNNSRQRRSRSPVRGRKPYNPRRRFRSPPPGEDFEEGPRYRSASRHSAQSADSRYSSRSRHASLTMDTRQAPSLADESFRSPSPHSLRPGPNYDAENAAFAVERDAMRDAFPQRGMRQFDEHSDRPSRSRPYEKRRYSASPQPTDPSNSYHGSPQPTSPYSRGRGGRSGQQGHKSPYQNTSYNEPPGYPSGPSFRGGHSGYRGNYPGHGNGRRFSASGSQNHSNGPSPRGRGHFSNSQRRGSNSWGRAPAHSPHAHHHLSQSPPPPPPPDNQTPPSHGEGGLAFDHTDRDRKGENAEYNAHLEHDESQNLPPTGPSDTSATPNKGGKISFAFKAKTTPAPAPKPVPDLAQRMLAREPPSRVAEPPRRMPLGPPKFKPEPRFDRRDRDRHRDRDRDNRGGRGDRRGDFRDSRGFREPRDGRDNRRDERRFDNRHEKRRGDRRQDFRSNRRRDRSPQHSPPRSPEHHPSEPRQPRVLTRPKPRPTLPDEFAKSDSVYYRKPGNESVIGAGTYGKVFKGIHIYTQRAVALKKIRMEGEKDGFPITAVREIKLLQHLRSHNVVSLLEVMVEKNECFMVFEYLSHDLTGLINHPTFTLTSAHKKDLAKQMFEGLAYLHHRGVLHRDIKAANILISNRGQLKYADFGLARFFSKSRQLDYTNRVITIWYRPPELLLGETRYGPAVDVWSAACVYVEMFTKKAVFPGEGGEISQLDKLYNALGTPTRAEWPDLVEMPWFELMRPTEKKKRVFEEIYREVLTPAALDLVSQIFRYDPSTRPTAEEILAHPYFVDEEPQPQQAVELENIEGDWHEFESKALRKERDREARRAEYQRDKEKRRLGSSAPQSEREPKRSRPDEREDSQPTGPPLPQ